LTVFFSLLLILDSFFFFFSVPSHCLLSSRLPNKEVPQLIWLLNEGDIDFCDLNEEQIINHFEGISRYLTTKQGFCELSKDFHEIQQNSNEILPRSYNLGNSTDRDDFIDDFRLTTTIILLKLYLLSRVIEMLKIPNVSIFPPSTSSSSSSSTSTASASAMNDTILKNALFVGLWEIRIKVYGEYPGVNNSKYFKDREASSSLNEEEWYYLLSYYYSILQYHSDRYRNNHFIETLFLSFSSALKATAGYPTSATSKASIHPSSSFSLSSTTSSTPVASTFSTSSSGVASRSGSSSCSSSSPSSSSSYCISSFILSYFSFFYSSLTPLDYKVLKILELFKVMDSQFSLNGYMNIWIIKSPDSSCGIGMRLASRLEEILEVEKSMSGRIVQKYIENPLLIPSLSSSSSSVPPMISSSASTSLLGKTRKSLSSSFTPPAMAPAPAPALAPASAFAPLFLSSNKFDIRVWVLITSLSSSSLTAYIYSTVYGRRCSSFYSNDLSTLNNHFIHLTNYTLQKKHKKFKNKLKKEKEKENSVPVPAAVAAPEVKEILIRRKKKSAGDDLKDTIDIEEEVFDEEEEEGNEEDEVSSDDDEKSVHSKQSISSTRSATKIRHICKEARASPSPATPVDSNAANNNDTELLIRKLLFPLVFLDFWFFLFTSLLFSSLLFSSLLFSSLLFSFRSL
jgi:hypothetical protein